MLQFPHVTRLAESLSVRSLIQSSAHNRDYVVKHEVFCAVTPSAFRISPIGLLPRGKANAVTLLLSRLWLTLDVRKHLVSIDPPSLSEGGGHLGASFRRVIIAFRRSSFLTRTRSGALRLLNSVDCLGTVVLAPKWIVGAAHGDANAFSFAACNIDAAFDLGKSAINQLPTSFARKGLSFFLFGHGYLGNSGLIR